MPGDITRARIFHGQEMQYAGGGSIPRGPLWTRHCIAIWEMVDVYALLSAAYLS